LHHHPTGVREGERQGEREGERGGEVLLLEDRHCEAETSADDATKAEVWWCDIPATPARVRGEQDEADGVMELENACSKSENACSKSEGAPSSILASVDEERRRCIFVFVFIFSRKVAYTSSFRPHTPVA
jgi:hypothetical protein